ncbi:MAG TPA: ADOP family duplicated permease [Vicinamibacterales bacterium]|nr:ADOP family duplicated permease [Vicinamibacterales bacterium]
MLNDLKFALRRLRHSPGFTIIAALTVAVAIGANTAILSIADAVLFRPLPYRDADRLFLVVMRDPQTGQQYTNIPGAHLEAIDHAHRGLSSAGRIQSSSLPIETASGRQSVPMLRTSANYFDILGVTPALGRMFTAADAADFERVAVLSFSSWQTRFGGDRTIVGRDVTFGTRTTTVLGVLPRDFVFPAGTFFSGRPEVIAMLAPASGPPSNAFHPIYRLEPGVTREQAQAEIDAIVRPLQTAQNSGVPTLVDIRQTIYPTGRPIMRFLVAAGLLLLLLACANLANLLLARGRRQEREHAVRLSLGASRLRVLRPVLLEGLIVGAIGSAAAIALNLVSFDAIKAMVPSVAYGNAPVGIGWRVAAIAFSVGIGASLAFAALPAWRSTRLDVQALIRQRPSNRARAKGRVGRPMVAVQVAFAIVLVFGALVAARAFVAVLRTPLGFEPANVLTISVAAPETPRDAMQLYRQLVDLVRAYPGIEAAGGTGRLPATTGQVPWTGIRHPSTGATVGGVDQVLPGYFDAVGIRLLRGRSLEWSEPGAVVDMVVSEAAAKMLFGDTDAIGQTVNNGRDTTWRIVGVVSDVRMSLDREDRPGAYSLPAGPRVYPMTIVARARSRTGTLPKELSAAILAVAPTSGVTARWWNDLIGETTPIKNPRFQTTVLASFAGIALGLTALGLFGLVSFLVATRTRELGIRLAIGASPRSLVVLTMRQMLWPVAIGLIAGLLATRLLATLAEAQLFKVDTRDPATLAIASVVVLISTMIAAYLPARRAERIDPIVALRAE